MPSPQFTAPYRTWGFPAELIDKDGSLTFTTDDLAHALYVTGRAPGDQWAHGTASVWEWIRSNVVDPCVHSSDAWRSTNPLATGAGA